MTENSGQKVDDIELRKLRAEYWSKRLDHTLTHTQTSSRLIYIIDGAVLALMYFSIQTLGASRPVILFASLPTFLLVVLNGLHARLIELQRSWYSGINTKLMELLNVNQVNHIKSYRVLGSTHRVYRSMHAVIAIFLFLAALIMLLYGLGCFQELPMPWAKMGS
jgi:hypothetical protein